MKSLDTLKKLVVQKVKAQQINEIADKLKAKLISKYKEQTTDSDEVIGGVIDEFEKIKTRLTGNEKDITRYVDYKELKSVVNREKTARLINQVYDQLKKTDKNSRIGANELKPIIKKFLEIGGDMPKDYRKQLASGNIEEFMKIVNKVYEEIMYDKLLKQFSEDSPHHTKEQLEPYIKFYIENYNQIPLNTKKITDMGFYELETMINGLTAERDLKLSGKKDTSDIEMVYDENGLKIFAPSDRDQCIRLRNGKSWCTSASGSRSYYYNYRYNHNLTLYYVIDEDMPANDINKFSVVLVSPRGRFRFADGTNSGRYSGHDELPWSEIVAKVPKLAGLEGLFKPRPLSDEELALVNKMSNVSVGNDVMASFNNEKEAALWMEIKTEQLNDEQYLSLPSELKKKYIGLGYGLTKRKLLGSEPDVIEYYTNRKIIELKNKNIDQLDETDIALLRLPKLNDVRQELKPRFIETLKVGNDVKIEYPTGKAALFGELYGWNDLFELLPKNIKKLTIDVKNGSNLEIIIPDVIGEFKDLTLLSLNNCAHKISEKIGECDRLFSVIIKNNPNLISIPNSITDLPSLQFLFIENNPKVKLDPNFVSKLEEKGVSIMP